LSHAELQREHGDLAGALETLQAMRERHPRHHLVLEQLQRTLAERGDWAALLELLPELRKAKVLAGEELAELERRVWIARLQRAGEQGLDQGETALQPLSNAWQQLSSTQRQDPDLLLAYAGQLRALGAQEQAEEVLRKSLRQGYEPRLIRLYGQLRPAEGLLKQHPQDPQLLLPLGRLCLQNRLCGKAREYFEISLASARNPETCAELARLLASQGEAEQSNRLLQELLVLQGQRL